MYKIIPYHPLLITPKPKLCSNSKSLSILDPILDPIQVTINKKYGCHICNYIILSPKSNTMCDYCFNQENKINKKGLC